MSAFAISELYYELLLKIDDMEPSRPRIFSWMRLKLNFVRSLSNYRHLCRLEFQRERWYPLMNIDLPGKQARFVSEEQMGIKLSE